MPFFGNGSQRDTSPAWQVWPWVRCHSQKSHINGSKLLDFNNHHIVKKSRHCQCEPSFNKHYQLKSYICNTYLQVYIFQTLIMSWFTTNGSKHPEGIIALRTVHVFFYVWVKTHYNRTKHPPINLCSHQISLNVMCVHALIGHLITKVFAVVMYGVFWCAFVLCRVFCQLYFQHSAPRAGPPLRKLTAKRRTMSKQDRTPKQFR